MQTHTTKLPAIQSPKATNQRPLHYSQTGNTRNWGDRITGWVALGVQFLYQHADVSHFTLELKDCVFVGKYGHCEHLIFAFWVNNLIDLV